MKNFITYLLTFVFCVYTASAVSCITFSGCVDGSDYINVNNGILTLSHGSYDPMGQHTDCPGDYRYVLYLNGTAHTLRYSNGNYVIDRKNNTLYVELQGIDFITNISARGSISLLDNTVTLDDNGPTGASIYTVTMCGQKVTDNNVPEFGVIAGGIALIGAIAGIAIIRKRN